MPYRTTETNPAPAERVLKKPLVCRTVGFSPATLYRLIREGKFPAPIKLSEHAVGWLESEVQAFIQSRILATRGVTA